MTIARFLTSTDIDGLATPSDYVTAVHDGYRQHGEGAPTEPRRTLKRVDPHGMLTGYTAILPEQGAMGGYLYSAGFGKRDAWFITPLFDADSGEPLAVIDGTSMNPFKTGAAGAVAVDHLAREEAGTVGIIGSGPQARGQLRATATVRSLDSVRVFSPTRSHREAFAAEMSDSLSVNVTAVDDASSAVADVDIIITATTASDPVFDGVELRAGTHVTAMGQYHPAKRELDHTTIERSIYVIDLYERVTMDAGSFMSAMEAGVVDENHVHAELGEIVAGVVEGRTNDDEITVFDSGGTAIETVAAAHMLYKKAVQRDLGQEIEFAPASDALTGH